jgi:hypothetical protein
MQFPARFRLNETVTLHCTTTGKEAVKAYFNVLGKSEENHELLGEWKIEEEFGV